MSSGEVMSVLRLISELSFRSQTPPQGAASGAPQNARLRKKFQCEFATARELSVDTLPAGNLIVIGSGRTSWLMEQLQAGEGFRLHEHGIQGPRGDKSNYKDAVDDQPLHKYALLTRRLAPKKDRAILLVAANHGRGAEGLMNFITAQDKLADLFRVLSLGTALPEHLQVIFEVTISKEGGEAAIESVVPIEWCVDYGNGPASAEAHMCGVCGSELRFSESHYWGCPASLTHGTRQSGDYCI